MKMTLHFRLKHQSLNGMIMRVLMSSLQVLYSGFKLYALILELYMLHIHIHLGKGEDMLTCILVVVHERRIESWCGMMSYLHFCT